MFRVTSEENLSNVDFAWPPSRAEASTSGPVLPLPMSASTSCACAPAALPPPAESAASSGSTPSRPPPRGRGERVVVVDDDELIARATVLLLQKLGYRAQGHCDPCAAAASIRNQPQEIDLLVTDQSMPGLDGLDLAAHARAVRTDLPILIMSGYGTSISTATLAGAGVTELLRKPAHRDTIASAVDRLLHPPAAPR